MNLVKGVAGANDTHLAGRAGQWLAIRQWLSVNGSEWRRRGMASPVFVVVVYGLFLYLVDKRIRFVSG